jgi:preprotein translocase subunit SecD
MNKSLTWRTALLAGVVVIAVILFLPSVKSVRESLPEWWSSSSILGNKINLGLDLQGGMHLVYRVETEKAVRSSVERMMDSLKSDAAEKNIAIKQMNQTSDTGFDVVLEKPGDMDTFLGFVSGFGVLTTDSRAGANASFSISEADAKEMKTRAVLQALETIRNRIDQFGVAEPVIIHQGEDEILIQLPGIKDTKRALDLIGKTAQLEFKMVDDETKLKPALPASVTPAEADALVAEYKGKLPEGDEILFERDVDRKTGAVTKMPYLIKSKVMMTGDMLSEARMSPNPRTMAAQVNFSLNSQGAKVFGDLTRANVQKRMAIILDNNVYSAPVIQEPITGGSGVITGRFTDAEARDLAIVLRAGALPAPLKLLQNLTVGPTLGNDSIAAGKKAILLGLLLVLVFMIVYYGMSGAIADFAVGLNLVVLIGVLAALNATLTLPGIAGILLTIGMGVDSNVLIFERIREELRIGKSVRASIDGGYDKAFLTIVDSHVTTLITAAVLFQFGTGPIKGFAVTLSLGVMINLFTSLVGTKVVFDFINSKWKLEKLSI